MASSAPSTPKLPSNLPPVGCVSRWLPSAMGASPALRPGRKANTLPTSSTVTRQPRASASRLNQARTMPSSAVSVWRLMPPLTVPPKAAVSIRLAHRRCGSMRRLLGMVAPGVRYWLGPIVAVNLARGLRPLQPRSGEPHWVAGEDMLAWRNAQYPQCGQEDPDLDRGFARHRPRHRQALRLGRMARYYLLASPIPRELPLGDGA